MTHDRQEMKKHVSRGLAWIGAASSLVAMLDIVATLVILAFWVSQREYGIATLAITMFPMLDLFTDLGMTAAVVQRDDHSEEKISTVFWLNVTISTAVFIILAVVAPLLGAFHGYPIVGTMFIVYGGKLIFTNVYAIPSGMMRKQLRFKELSVIRVLANLAEFAGKIGFAAAGYGIWCFVLGPLCRVLVTGVGIQLCYPWIPRLYWRVREAADYFWFGMKASGSQILFYFYTNVDYQIVGYYFGPEANGLYTLAYQIVLEPVRVISDVVVQVAFPVFARLRRSRAQLVEQFIAFTRMNLVTVLSFLALIFVVVEDFIAVVIGPEWVPASAAVRILCAVGVFRALSFIVPPLLDGLGFPALTLIYTAVAAVVLPTLFWIFAVYGDSFEAVAVAWAIGYPIAFAVLAWIAIRKIGLSAFEYLRRTMGIPLCAGAAMGVAWLVSWLLRAQNAGLRFAVEATAFMAVMWALLATFQGISPRTIAASLKSKPAPPPAVEPARTGQG